MFVGKGIAAVLVLVGFTFLATRAEASCGSSHRVSASDSECLWETHTSGSYTVENHCLHWISVKIDIRNGRDKTLDVAAGYRGNCQATPILDQSEFLGRHCTPAADGNEIVPKTVEGTISTSWWRSIRAITCCSDVTDCDRRSSDSYP